MDIYEQEQPDGSFLKHIKFRFPAVSYTHLSTAMKSSGSWRKKNRIKKKKKRQVPEILNVNQTAAFYVFSDEFQKLI